MAAVQYEIVVRGRLGDAVVRSFDNLEVGPDEPSETHLLGWFDDQRSLQLFLTELGELGIDISSVRTLAEDA
ncbi:MAG TPA: hypothetical protein VFJ85_19220 [Acidimicrobiales bacterium]|nr:hypothetical protein [Acidimicrobiales bacterium]